MYEQTVTNVLTIRRLPARLSVEQTAELLGFTDLEMPILMKMKTKLLMPLGHPPANGQKFFATEDILQLAADRDWLDRASKAVSGHWKAKNVRRRTRIKFGSTPPTVPRPIYLPPGWKV